MTPKRAMTSLLPAGIVLSVLAAVAFGPAQALHMANHKLAMGQPLPIVWALMVFDALWVGLFAALVGSALFVGVKTGLTWKGWTVHPRDLDATVERADDARAVMNLGPPDRRTRHPGGGRGPSGTSDRDGAVRSVSAVSSVATAI